ncbi:transcriptional regulator, TetR family [Plantibacter flavus]|uniref:TetR family transcriptional regulator n=1 Tax=Plantibacter flavus TaxID=150123 RepID=A0A3N2BY35_9MICO|nr:TetR/AcrR family transcriptional regulator [Plantibacter flavus]ROR80092.1 TetR family transcriptional regulator [Plantibacter flavus]SMG29290.1 transcriptional regulator, TetR family [Plantibacter flavus]
MQAQPSLWQRSREAAYAEIARVAMELFLEQGFEQTTIDQIVAEAGISRRSFFRYFGTKEDVVLGDLAGQGELVREALEAVPDEVEPWDALRLAMQAVDALQIQPGVTLKIATMMYRTPSLRSRSIEKHLHWQALLVPEIRRRLAVGDDDPAPEAIVATAIACLDVAGERWVSGGGVGDLSVLYDRAVAGVRSGS